MRLELAADWLVMAAWLAWLKSRLLLPADEADAEEGEQAAGMLAEAVTVRRPVAHVAVTAVTTWAVLGGTSLGREAATMTRLLAEFGVRFDPVGAALNSVVPWAFDLVYGLAGHRA